MKADLKQVLYYFNKISQIPRCSGDEQAISDYLLSVATKNGLQGLRDHANNVLIRKKASLGHETAKPVMLQGHMDMVCVKSNQSIHDFSKDGITVLQNGDYLYADGTTLGADNAIGIAFSLAVLTDLNAVHPPLEALFTTGEETGMTGACQLDVPYLQIKSKTLINLDTAWEGVFIASASGGVSIVLCLNAERTQPKFPCFAHLMVGGLLGGHSGLNIGMERANAILVLARVLFDLGETIELADFSCISPDNAIPTAANATLAYENVAVLEKKISELNSLLKKEYAQSDPGIQISLQTVLPTDTVLCRVDEKKLLSLLLLLPNGVICRDAESGLVLTSCNLACVQEENGSFTVRNSVRSSVQSQLYTLLIPRYTLLTELFKLQMVSEGAYPAWDFSEDSEIRTLAMKCYEKESGKQGSIVKLHAALECGCLIQKLGTVDAISMGPELNNCHTTEENLSLPSVEMTYNVLKEILRNIK